jgi:hypothetical protein
MIKKLIVIAILFSSLFSTNAYAWDDCPHGEVNDPYPGDCARYVDTDGDGICDHSQPAPEDRNDDNNIIATEKDLHDLVTGQELKNDNGSVYHLLPISLSLLFLYIVTSVLSRKKIISIINHKKIWNILLLFAFLISGTLSILLVIRMNFDIAIA